jgi:hypothetical protein
MDFGSEGLLEYRWPLLPLFRFFGASVICAFGMTDKLSPVSNPGNFAAELVAEMDSGLVQGQLDEGGP